jgi:ABC-type polysaccharide/polyol phosphate export permease
VVYGVVLTQSFDVDGNGIPYLSMAWSGLVLWTFFSGALGSSAVSLIYSADLITKVYFPKEAIPLSMVGASMVDLGIGLLTVVIIMPIQGLIPTWTAIFGLLPLLVLISWAAALSVFVAVLAAFIRDVPHAVQLIIRVGFFITPVMYDAESLPPSLRWTAVASPVAASIDGFREAVLRGNVPDLPVLLAHLVVGVSLFVASVSYTRAVEARLTDVV